MAEMKWKTLLNLNRIGRCGQEQPFDRRSPFQIDFDRIIFCSAFRRLQDKTQVFPLSNSDYVRTRLTHSLEVSCVGRSLGTMVGETICRDPKLKLHASDIGSIVAAACLAHDLGNPPLGHSGEDAIRHWFVNSEVAKGVKKQIPPVLHPDLINYEGNAQGFRLITRILHPESPGGLQLTYATLGTFAKYPLESNIPEGERQGKAGAKKFGFFQSESEFFDDVAINTGLLKRKNHCRWWCRHPLAFLMEAADDICYRTIDFEDGYRLNLIGYEEVRDNFCEILRKTPSGLAHIKSEGGKVQYLRALTLNALVVQVAKKFLDVEKQCLKGTFDSELISLIPAADVLDEIKKITINKIYSDCGVVEIEAAGFEVLGGLLDAFVGAAFDVVQAQKAKVEPSPRSKKLLQLIPEQFLGEPMKPHKDYYICLLNMIDFVCGMTDSFAVSTFKKISGISLP